MSAAVFVLWRGETRLRYLDTGERKGAPWRVCFSVYGYRYGSLRAISGAASLRDLLVKMLEA